MLITKFNRMIRNKLIWGIVAVVVSLAFVLSFGSVPGCDAPPQTGIATLYGEDVRPGEFQTAVFFEQNMGADRGAERDPYDQVEQRAWRRLAMLRTAARLGIRTPDEEIGRAIHEEPGFGENGVFDRNRYLNFVRTRGVTVETFEAYLRQSLTLQKLFGILESMVWTAPAELTERLRNLTDDRVAEYTHIPFDHLDVDLTPSADAIRAFYEADPARFTAPERVRVRYVELPMANYRPEAIEDSVVQDYYETHIDRFTPASTNAYERPLPLPLDDVRDAIIETLKTERTAFQARDAAMSLVIELAPDRFRNQRPLDEVVAQHGLNIATTAWFTIDAPVPGLDVGPAFNQAAFSLIEGDPEYYFSDAVMGSNAVYVLATSGREPSHIPPFEDVAEAVAAAALADARAEAFTHHVETIREAIVTAIASNETFTAAAAAWNLTATSTPPFSVIGGLTTNELPFARIVVPQTIDLREGDVSEPIETPDGAVLLYLASRTPGAPENVYALRPQLLRTLQEFRVGLLLEAWGDYILDIADFQDGRQLPPPDEDGDADAPDQSG